MKKAKEGSIAVIVVLVILVLGGVAAFVLFSSGSSGTSGVTENKQAGQLSSTDMKGDINRDGVANEEDAMLIRASSPCNHADACWSKVVGKTKDGDNPIYASDLDLNKDENINEMDISAMSTE